MSQTPPETLQTPPPAHEAHLLLSYPIPHVLLLTLNRPKALNAVDARLRLDIRRVMDWFETEPDLWLIIVTGAGHTFCAGADLKEWEKAQSDGTNSEIADLGSEIGGFASLSRRYSTKPILAAVNGHAFGGGLELILNCDLVVASEKARLGLPEVKVGVVAAAGGIPRLVAVAGHQKASELLLTGKQISAVEARDRFGFVNQVVAREKVLSTTLALAKTILANSPDAIRSTKRAINESHRTGDIERAYNNHAASPEGIAVYSGRNIQEGLTAFLEKRQPQWENPRPKL